MSETSNPTTHRTPGSGRIARGLAATVGVVFLVVGVLGFIPGVTTHYGDMTFAGHTSGAELVGLFQISVLHNIVHLLFGVIGLALSRRATTATAYLVVGGVVYLILWIYGLVVMKDSAANIVPLNDADDWLHLMLGLGMIVLGILGRRATAAEASGVGPSYG